MPRAYEKYIKAFGVKGFEHSDVDFKTPKGLNVSLRWNKSEYRAYKKTPDGRLEEMFLGSVVAEHLKEYIITNF